MVFFLLVPPPKVLSVEDGKIPTKKKWKSELKLHILLLDRSTFTFLVGILPSSTLRTFGGGTSQKKNTLYISKPDICPQDSYGFDLVENHSHSGRMQGIGMSLVSTVECAKAGPHSHNDHPCHWAFPEAVHLSTTAPCPPKLQYVAGKNLHFEAHGAPDCQLKMLKLSC